jgi:Pyruvate/2-oxoacid:ferredoxin oxidoreductase gamma subunit
MLKIIVSGKGGQGIQFLAMLLAKNAIYNKYNCTVIKSYGPEARSGASQASVIIDYNPITNPVVKKADYLIAFTQEAVDMWGSRSKNIIYHDDMNNMEMLGKFIKVIDGNIEEIIETMKHIISDKYIDRREANILNLRKGYNS